MDSVKKPRKVATPAPATAEQTSSEEPKKGPVKTIRVDDVSASIWARERLVRGDKMTFYSVTFERSYRDNTGQWRYTRYFDLNDLAKLITAGQQANDFIVSLQYPDVQRVHGN